MRKADRTGLEVFPEGGCVAYVQMIAVVAQGADLPQMKHLNHLNLERMSRGARDLIPKQELMKQLIRLPNGEEMACFNPRFPSVQ